MPLFDYICIACRHFFEQIARSADDSEAGTCPKCAAPGAERQVARFRVGGRGDLRESSEFHGCHPAEAESNSGGSHRCGGGCSHGSETDP